MDLNWHRSPAEQKRALWLALGVWALSFVIVSVIVVRHPQTHTENPVYVKAAQDWWAHRDLYPDSTIDGFLYFPHAAIIYTPFEWAGRAVGDVGWRLAGWAILCHAMYRGSKILLPKYWMGLFAIATWVAIWPGLGSLRTGQANLQLAALMFEAAVELAQGRWWRAAIWMMAGLAIKPIIAVMILLVGAIYRPMTWRLLVALAIFPLLPFLFGDFHYVLRQYVECYHKLGIAVEPDRPFTDFYWLMWAIGWTMPHAVLVAIQVIAAAATLAFCGWITKTWKEPWRASLLVTMSAAYLMLFNPRTMLNSYIIVAPAMAFAVGLLYYQERRFLAIAMGVVTVAGLTCDGWAFKLTYLWLKQVVCIAFILMVVMQCIARRRKEAAKGSEAVEMAETA